MVFQVSFLFQFHFSRCSFSKTLFFFIEINYYCSQWFSFPSIIQLHCFCFQDLESIFVSYSKLFTFRCDSMYVKDNTHSESRIHRILMNRKCSESNKNRAKKNEKYTNTHVEKTTTAAIFVKKKKGRKKDKKREYRGDECFL